MTKRYEALFTPHFIEDLTYWVKTNSKIAENVLKLVGAILRDPTGGIGKPERFRYVAGTIWSRRINKEHRLVYRITESRIDFLQAQYHY